MTTSMEERDGWIWLDGSLVPWKSARIHVLTHGLHYASAVFEGERAYADRIFKLKEHTARLAYSASCADMKLPFTETELEQASMDVIAANKLANAYVRPLAWRGSEQLAAAAPSNSIHVTIAAWAWDSYFDPTARMKGVRLKTATWRRPPPECAPAQAKAASSYLITTIAKHAALRDGFDDALLLDWRGNVAEASAANIFFAGDGEIHTPVPDCFLNGITRQSVIEIAERLGHRVIQRHIRCDEIHAFPECFLTGTASEITPVASIDDRSFTPGSVTRSLIEAYADEVLADTRR